MTVTIVGVTATRSGLTEPQRAAARIALVQYRPTLLVHGGAIGGDDDLDQLACELRIPRLVLPSDRASQSVPLATLRARWERVDYWAAADPLRRNRRIISLVERMLAFPGQRLEQKRGGTWATIRYTRTAGKPLQIFGPDGAAV